ncbi:MAG: type 1 glutamine amidotransferase domain-containing protein [Candidatus Sericytochromatia bacterium]
MTKEILIPIPDFDFDLTEVSIPWKYFRDNGFNVTFSTENANIGKTDTLLISGVLFGQLGAKKESIETYYKLEKEPEFLNPIKYSDIIPEKYDLILLAGGHAKGMRQYLESKILQEKVLEFFNRKKIIGSICHGPIVLSRTINPENNKSIIYGKKLTALTKQLEMTAYFLTFWLRGDYYRTYPEYVQDEISRNLSNKDNFKIGDSMWKPFYVEDENLITSRWPNDVDLFSKKLIEKLQIN